MFRVNDTVMYGSAGVCTIVDIRTEKFTKNEELYYILKPVYHEKSTIYCPVDNEKIKIRKLLSLKEVHELIRVMPDTELGWIDNDQQRRETFTKILRDGDHRSLIKLIKSIYFNREERQKAGKRSHAADEKIMKEAESILYEELAHVLNIKPDEVVPFIVGAVDTEEG